MQRELLDRHRWSMRTELANAIFGYLEFFHNRRSPRPVHPRLIPDQRLH
jgi:hypothetical protein